LDLFELFDLEVKGQGPTKVITVCGQRIQINPTKLFIDR
jgi:hypothetical protein